MKKQTIAYLPLATVFVFAFAFLLLPRFAYAQNITQSGTAGAYSITLKVMPAEAFQGPKAEMARDGGAQPTLLDSATHPNHHLVVFLKKDGQPVEDAKVEIRYSSLTSRTGTWIALPVVRMHVVGKGLATTHFGNNAQMSPATYEVRVTVNGEGPAIFRVVLK